MQYADGTRSSQAAIFRKRAIVDDNSRLIEAVVPNAIGNSGAEVALASVSEK